MAGALSKFLEKINFTKEEEFDETEVNKVEVHKLDNTWTIHITNKTPINVETLESLKAVSMNGFDNVKGIDFVINNHTFHDQDILEYIKYYMEVLSTKSPALRSLKGNDIIVTNKEIKIEVTNKVESNLIKSKKDKILEWLKLVGMPGCTISTYTNETKRNKVKAEIEKIKSKCENEFKEPKIALAQKKDKPVLEIKGTALFGITFDTSKVVNIKDITDEKRGVNICAKITDIRAIESARTEYKIFTIKVSDGTQFTCKLFTTDKEVYQFLLKNLKEDCYYYFRGSVQNDNYMHSLVLNIRSIMECDKKDEQKKDEFPVDDYGYIPEYIPEDDYYLEDDGFFAFSNDLPQVEEKLEELPKTFIEDIPKPKKEVKLDETVIIGSKITGKSSFMKDITMPVNNAIFECKIFGVDLFESPKNNIKIITLKLTDKTDSYICKLFTKDSEEYKRLKSWA